MKKQNRKILLFLLLNLLLFLYGAGKSDIQLSALTNTEFVNGKWFNGKSFDSLTAYSVDGTFTFNKPETIDRTIDLQGMFIVPPFGEAHNHNIGTGVIEWDKTAINNYLNAGVFYVKIMGNLPVNDETKSLLGINKPGGLDVLFAQGNITATNGHPIGLVNKLLTLGYYKGYTKEQLKDYRYFTIDSVEDLNNKWSKILSHKPDFIKIFLCNTEMFEKTKNTSVWYKGLDPKMVPFIVNKAHEDSLKVTAHINSAADFHLCLIDGVDEIAHFPRMISGIPYKQISPEDALLASQKKVPVITTVAVSLSQGGTIKPEDYPLAKKYQTIDMKTLYQKRVQIAIGSDNVNDNSVQEIFYIKDLGVFDNLTLLKMWTETTAKVIFPNRKIGALKEGYEASFLALGGNPLDDFNNVKKIKLSFKQGIILKNDLPTGIEKEPSKIPSSFRLEQNYPNPFNPSTTIKYSLPKASYVTLKVYDILGKEVATLVNAQKPAGNYQVEFDASSLASGVYFYKIQAAPAGRQTGNFSATRKFLLQK